MAEAFLCEYIRTPFGRLGGGLAPVRTDDLAALPLQALMARRSGLDWGQVDEVILGCANQAGEDNRNVARMALLLAGMPVEVPGVTVNRLCASGLEAVIQGARALRLGEADLVVAGGVESMTRSPYVLPKAPTAFGRGQVLEDTTLGWRLVNPRMEATHGVDALSATADAVAREWGVSREAQDGFAFRSQQRAAASRAAGWFEGELIPVTAGTGKKAALVAADEHPRADTTLAQLQSLAPLAEGGTVTAGNATGLNDGACALVLASEAGMSLHGLQPLARIVGAAAHGVPPRIMGVGPVGAVQKLNARLGWRMADYDVIEFNEAFAAQVLAVARDLGLPEDAEHLNPHGGAIALGHPLGASGARLAGTAARELQRRGGRRALVSLCVGVGQGLALALERP